MKILAIEKNIPGVDWNTIDKTLLEKEALDVYEMYLAGQLREHYFSEEKFAVLVLECESKVQAQELLSRLPLVKNRLITFDIMELRPYTGFDRIIKL